MNTNSTPNPKWWLSDPAAEPVPEGTLPPAWMVRLVWLLLPRALRDENADLFNVRYLHVFEMIGLAISIVTKSYRVQSVVALRLTSRVVELLAVWLCFSGTATPLVLAITVLALMSLLTLRDGHTHIQRGSARDCPYETTYTSEQYYFDCGLDAALTAVLLFGLQAIALNLVPGQTQPHGFAYIGAFLAVPLMSAFRMAIRPNPAEKDPFGDKNLSIAEVCWWTRSLNITWMVAGSCLVMTSMKAVAQLAPTGNLYIILSALAFALLYRLPQNALERDDVRLSLELVRLKRARQMLFRAIPKADSQYRQYLCLQVLVFLTMLTPIAVGLRFVLVGRPAGVNMFQVLFNLAVFLAMLMSWNFVKITNHGASKRLEEEIARLERESKSQS